MGALSLLLGFLWLVCGQERWSLEFTQQEMVTTLSTSTNILQDCDGTKHRVQVGVCTSEPCFDSHFKYFVSSQDIGHFCEYVCISHHSAAYSQDTTCNTLQRCYFNVPNGGSAHSATLSWTCEANCPNDTLTYCPSLFQYPRRDMTDLTLKGGASVSPQSK